jgi:hypothetical protein
MTPGGSVGFARAIGPAGETNIVLHDPPPQRRVELPIGAGAPGGPGQDIEQQGFAATGRLQGSPLPVSTTFAALAPYAAATAYTTRV